LPVRAYVVFDTRDGRRPLGLSGGADKPGAVVLIAILLGAALRLLDTRLPGAEVREVVRRQPVPAGRRRFRYVARRTLERAAGQSGLVVGQRLSAKYS
jgi:hypothetical protein